MHHSLLKPLKSLLMLTMALGTWSCKPLVNYMTFYPDKVHTIPTEKLPPDIEEVFLTTTDEVRIHALYLPHADSETVLLYFHGNAGNVYYRIPDLDRLRDMGVNVLGVSYRGYGKSGGSPSEEGIYLDGEAALDYAVNTLGFPMENVILFGRSIGSTVAVHLAQHKNILALILVTPLTSGKAVAQANDMTLLAPLAGDIFDNLKKIENVDAPLLVIHGTDDRIIPTELGKALYEKAEMPKRLAVIEGAGHNDLQNQAAYWSAIENFLSEVKR